MLDVKTALRGYRVGELIGSGARSVIYEVIREEDGKRFAAKCVLVRAKEDLSQVRHLRNEYKVLRTLHREAQGGHAIVRPVEFKRVRSLFKVQAAYLVMERVLGQSLADRSDYSLLRSLHIFLQVSRALEYIHSRGLVHADLKPHNILVEKGGHVKLIDFGFTVAIGSRLNGLRGTWGYLAPEQAGGQIDPQTDVFNLGAAMYWYFTGENIPAILPKKRGRGGFIPARRLKLTPPNHLNPELPEKLSELIRRSCKSDPAKRPSMHGVSTQLHDLLLEFKLIGS